MKQDNSQLDNEYKDLAYTKPTLSQSMILDTNIRSTLSGEEKTDLIIKQLMLLKDNEEEVKSYERKHKQSINQLISSITTGEEVLGYLVDNISQINNGLKEQFEKSHKHSTLEELIILKEEYKKRNSGRGRVASAPKSLKFESTYIPFTQDDRGLMLDNNLQRSTERKETYGKIFEMLREDMGSIIKQLKLDTSPMKSIGYVNHVNDNIRNTGYVHDHNDSYKFSDVNRYADRGVNIPKINFETDRDDFVNLKTVNVKTTEMRSRSVDRRSKQRTVRIFSWDKMDWERNNINVRKDINHFIEVKEELSDSDLEDDINEEENKEYKHRGDLLKNIYDLCCKFDLDDYTLRRMVKKLKHKDGVKEKINKEKVRVRAAEYQPNLCTTKRAEVVVPHIEGIAKIIEAKKAICQTKPIASGTKTQRQKNMVITPKVETKTFRKHKVGLNLNNISNLSNSITMPKKAGMIGKGYNKGNQLLKPPHNDYFIISPKGQTTNHDTFFNSQFSDLRQSNRLFSSGEKGNSQTHREILKGNNSKDNTTLGSFIFTPDYFTNPHTNPFTKNLPQYRPKTTAEVCDGVNDNTKTIQNSQHEYSGLVPRKIDTSLTESSNPDSSKDSKVSRVAKKKALIVDIDKMIIQGVDESFVVLDNNLDDEVKINDEAADNPARVNKPHYKNYMSNSMNERSYDIVLKNSNLFGSALITSKESSFVIEPKVQISPLDMPRDAELCGVSVINNI
jgi:hypothetical protein